MVFTSYHIMSQVVNSLRGGHTHTTHHRQMQTGVSPIGWHMPSLKSIGRTTAMHIKSSRTENVAR